MLNPTLHPSPQPATRIPGPSSSGRPHRPAAAPPAAIAGAPPPVEEAPWFWSDQYDLKLQIAGLFQGYDQTVLRGDPAARSFAFFYLKAGKLIAVDAVNRPAEYLGAKQIIQRRASVAPALLSDMSKPFKEIVAAAA